MMIAVNQTVALLARGSWEGILFRTGCCLYIQITVSIRKEALEKFDIEAVIIGGVEW